MNSEITGRDNSRVCPRLRLLFVGGSALVVLAALLTLLLLPEVFIKKDQEAFVSQVHSVRVSVPEISATAFAGPDNRSVVLWIEGAPAIPGEETAR